MQGQVVADRLHEELARQIAEAQIVAQPAD
jgi:hypothetical protein